MFDDTLALVQAQQQLVYWWRETGRCPCGARDDDDEYPHVDGCPTGIALAGVERTTRDLAARLGITTPFVRLR